MATRKSKTKTVSSSQESMQSTLTDSITGVRSGTKATAGKPVKTAEGSMPCSWRINGERCGNPVPGIDPCRSCERCRREHTAPVRIPWEMAKPDNSSTSGESILVLTNAGLIKTGAKP